MYQNISRHKTVHCKFIGFHVSLINYHLLIFSGSFVKQIKHLVLAHIYARLKDLGSIQLFAKILSVCTCTKLINLSTQSRKYLPLVVYVHTKPNVPRKISNIFHNCYRYFLTIINVIKQFKIQ